MQPNSSNLDSKPYRPPVAPKPVQKLFNQTATFATTSTTLSSLVPSLDAIQLGITISSTSTPRISPASSTSNSRSTNMNVAQIHSHSASPAASVTSTADLLDLDSVHLRSIEQTLLPLLQQVCYFNLWAGVDLILSRHR